MKKNIIIIFVLLLVLLSGCANNPTISSEAIKRNENRSIAEIAIDAEQAYNNTVFNRAAEDYFFLSQSDKVSKDKQSEYLIYSTRARLDGHDYKNAEKQLKMLDQQVLAEPWLTYKKILQVDFQVSQGQISITTALVNDLATQIQSIQETAWKQRFLQDAIHVYETSGNRIASVQMRIHLHGLLLDEEARYLNTDHIYKSLFALSVTDLYNSYQNIPAHETTLRPWVELVLGIKQNIGDNQAIFEHIANFQKQNPGHPTTDQLTTALIKEYRIVSGTPGQIAVLLPLSHARFAGFAQAVKEGIQAAYDADMDNAGINLQFYDTTNSDFLAVYQKAVSEGAEYVIGPLTKERVDVLMHLEGALPVPTISLNWATDPGFSPLNLYQFGVLPEDEIIQVAAEINFSIPEKIIILAPDNSVGQRFTDTFLGDLSYSYDDSRIKVINYAPNTSNFTSHINQIKQAIDNPANSALYLIATPGKARLIMPFLSVYDLGTLPVYTTSGVYGGNPSPISDKELEGLMFCDMPWSFLNSTTDEFYRYSIDHYPSSVVQGRIFAMGVDAYTIFKNLAQLEESSTFQIQGVTGVLYAELDRKIHRKNLVWARFTNGYAVLRDDYH